MPLWVFYSVLYLINFEFLQLLCKNGEKDHLILSVWFDLSLSSLDQSNINQYCSLILSIMVSVVDKFNANFVDFDRIVFSPEMHTVTNSHTYILKQPTFEQREPQNGYFHQNV